jgi:hypothetical protein
MSKQPALRFQDTNLAAWRNLDDQIKRLKADGYTPAEIAHKTSHTETVVRMRLWRMGK